jgi:nitroreductase
VTTSRARTHCVSPPGDDRPKTREEAEQVLALIKARRSVRRFTMEPVTEEQIELLLDAGRWAPTTFQCWQFIVVDDDSLLPAVISLAPGILQRPTLVIVVCADVNVISAKNVYPELAYQETATATQNILLAASALGLGTCFIGSFSKAGIAAALNLPPRLEIHNLIALGHPAEAPEPPPRKPLSEIVVRNAL